jgi:hypothetical protein
MRTIGVTPVGSAAMHRMGAVLHVDEQPVVIGGGGQHRGRAGA